MLNLIVPFVIGVLVGQELQDLPRLRPLIEKGFIKITKFCKDIIDNP
jgi:hypothetical protein